MTWVIGASSFLGGYGIVISDIQVTCGNQRYDILRKAYPIGPYLVGGFAGSVQIGFALLESISNFLRVPTGLPPYFMWHPNFVAEHWAPIARQVFNSSNIAQQNLGSQFVFVGPDPAENVIPGRAKIYICKFTFPDFEPEIFPGGHLAESIGSGNGVEAYTHGLREAMNWRNNGGILQAEVGNTGGWGMAMNIVITTIFQDTPVDGISPYIHIHQVERGQFKFGNNNRDLFPREGDENQEITAIRMPPVAQNFTELCQMLNDLNVDATFASC